MDLMHDAISSLKVQLTESQQKNDTDFSTVTKSIVEKIDAFGNKQSYADALSGSLPSSSKSSAASSFIKSSRKASAVACKPADKKDSTAKKDTATKKATAYNKFKGQPLISGTSETTSEHLGKEVVITKRSRQRSSDPTTIASTTPKLSKALYVTRFEPTVTAEGLLSFLHARVEDLDENKITIRMLVKRDQDLSELSFISFRILCTEDLFAKLNVPEFWPSYIKLREFVFEQKKPHGDRTASSQQTNLEDSPKNATESYANSFEVDSSKNGNPPPVQASITANTPSMTVPDINNASASAVHPTIKVPSSPEQMES